MRKENKNSKPTHAKMRQLVIGYYEGFTSLEEEELVKKHLIECHSCSNTLEQLKSLYQLMVIANQESKSFPQLPDFEEILDISKKGNQEK